jgi:TonB family protein
MRLASARRTLMIAMAIVSAIVLDPLAENNQHALAFSHVGLDAGVKVEILPRTDPCGGEVCEPVTSILTRHRDNWYKASDAVVDGTRVPRMDMAQPPSLLRFYPPVSKRLGEEGTVVARVTVDPDGHVLDAKIAKSSGFERLDAAAIEYAQKMLHFVPFSSNKPASTLYKIVFKLSPAPPPQQ